MSLAAGAGVAYRGAPPVRNGEPIARRRSSAQSPRAPPALSVVSGTFDMRGAARALGCDAMEMWPVLRKGRLPLHRRW
jgi:hypothetical protein